MTMSINEARDLKAARSKERAAAPGATWLAVAGFPSWQEAVDFANLEPAQAGGEFIASHNADGTVDGSYFF
ncbi:hypothetical protein ABZ958_37510 [Streptomyces sp. NPDC046237]|uniref:hypothetical protein n=1 Tax=Streptomyces sp. NPDC046237 TaxID=3154914 RepID=UPI0033F1F97E